MLKATGTPRLPSPVLGLLVLSVFLTPLGAGIITGVDSWRVRMNDSGSVAFAAYVRDGQGRTGALFLSLPDGSRIPVAFRRQNFPIPGHSFVRLLGPDLALNNQNDILFAAEVRADADRLTMGAILLYLHESRELIVVLAPVDVKPESDPGIWVRVGLNDSGVGAFAVTVEGQDRLYLYDVPTKTLKVVAQEGDDASGGGTYLRFDRTEINQKGTLLFQAKLADRGRPSLFTEPMGFFIKPISGPVQLVYSDGDLLPTEPQVEGNLARLGLFQLAEDDTVLFDATMQTPESMGGLFAALPDGQLRTLAVDQQKVGDLTLNMRHTSGVLSHATSFLSPNAYLNDAGEVMFETGPRGSTFLTSLESSEILRVCIGCTVAQGAETVLVSSLAGFNDAGEALFRGQKNQFGVGTNILLRQSSGEMQSLLDLSAPVPETPDLSFWTLWPVADQASALNNRGDVLFDAVVLLEPTRHGLFVVNTEGVLRKVAVEGDLVLGSSPVRWRSRYPRIPRSPFGR